VWRAIPSVRPSVRVRPGSAALTEWLDECGYRTLLLQPSCDADASCLVMLFRPGAPEPSFVLKVPECPRASARLAAEASRLRVLAAAPMASVHGTVPEEVRVDVPAQILATTALSGTPMLVEVRRSGHTRRPAAVGRDFTAAGAWLAALQCVRTGPSAPLDVPDSTLEAADTVLSGWFGDRSLALTALVVLRRSLRRYTAPQTVVHGDFWPGNILMRNGELTGVVDWERTEAAGSPVRDLARFAVTYSLHLDAGTPPGGRVRGHPDLVAGSDAGGVGYLLEANGWYPQLVREYLAAGLRRLGVPASVAAHVVLVELAAMAAEATDADSSLRLWRMFTEMCRPQR
jgi:hypothetical protein